MSDSAFSCPQDRLSEVLALIEVNEEAGIGAIEALTNDYPDDPRLNFLAGSIAASRGDYPLALAGMARAVESAPDFAIARFQYGLLLLTSGEAASAATQLAPLTVSVEGPLRWFAIGLMNLMQDSFEQAAVALERGLAFETDNPALHADMTMLLTEIRNKQQSMVEQGDVSQADTIGSATQQLLLQAALRSTRH